MRESKIARTEYHTVLVCDTCHKEFQPEQRAEAEEHERTHEKPRYFSLTSDVVYLTEGCLRERTITYFKKTTDWRFDHRKSFATQVEWAGEGWYELHTYVDSYGDEVSSMVPVQEMIDNQKEAIKTAAERLRFYKSVLKVER